MDKLSPTDLVSKGQGYAHDLADANISNINIRMSKIDAELNGVSDVTQRQTILAAMDKELSDKGLLPSAMKVFAEQNDNHNILKADRRGIHADSLAYNLNPSDSNNASKLTRSGHWDAQQSPVEMMMTGELYNNVNKITPGGDDDEVTFGRLDSFAKKAEQRNNNVAGATAMLKEYDNRSGFYGLSQDHPTITKDYIQNALEFPQTVNGDRKTLEWMNQNYKDIAGPHGITSASMHKYAGEQGINVQAAELPPAPVLAPPADASAAIVVGKKDMQPALKDTAAAAKLSDKVIAEKVQEDADASSIKAKDQHIVKAGDRLASIAIAELQSRHQLSGQAAIAHQQIAYEEHLIRLYTPKIFAHLPNYNGALQPNWVLNLVPERQMQQELEANTLKHHRKGA